MRDLSQGSAWWAGSGRVLVVPRAYCPVIHAASRGCPARAQAAVCQAADFPAVPRAAARWVSPALAAEFRSARSASISRALVERDNDTDVTMFLERRRNRHAGV